MTPAWDQRYEHRTKRPKRDFAYTGLIRCGHCGCLLVAQLQKGKYVYYHCSGAKGKCPEPYTGEEVFDEQLAEVLGGLRFDDEVLEWATGALRASHDDEKRYHDEVVARRQESALRGIRAAEIVEFAGLVLDARAEPIRSDGGTVEQVVFVGTDVTEQRRMQDALAESAARYRMVEIGRAHV